MSSSSGVVFGGLAERRQARRQATLSLVQDSEASSSGVSVFIVAGLVSAAAPDTIVAAAETFVTGKSNVT
jgi:hypothetical protein